MEDRMKRKLLLLACGVMVMGSLLGACGNVGSGQAGNGKAVQSETSVAPELVAKWSLVQFTVNGKTSKAEELLPDVRLRAPEFTCEDGTHCEIKLNGKSHAGTISNEDGTYVISFNDTDQKMTVTLDGDVLELTNTKGTVTMVFQLTEQDETAAN